MGILKHLKCLKKTFFWQKDGMLDSTVVFLIDDRGTCDAIPN